MPLINNKLPKLVTLGDVAYLWPGANEVDPKVWASFKSTVVVKAHLDAGDLVETDAEDLKGLGVEAALALVKDTLNVDLMRKWRESETRPKVQRGLDAKIAEMVKALDGAKKDEG